MANFEIDEEILSSETYGQQSDDLKDSNFRKLVLRTKQASISAPVVSVESYATGGSGNLLQHSRVVTRSRMVANRTEKCSNVCNTSENHLKNNHDRNNEHLMMSGPFGLCDYPCCTTCPTYLKATQKGHSRTSTRFNSKLHNVHGDASRFGRKKPTFCSSCIPGVMNPHTKVVQQWNMIHALFCWAAIILDPLFLFLFYVQRQQEYPCIAINSTMTAALVSFRSINDLMFLLNILVQFRLAFVSRVSPVDHVGYLVDHPKKIVLQYLRGFFLFDLLVVIPLPQIMVLFVLPNNLGSWNHLLVAILVQYIPRLHRFLPLLNGQSPTGLVFESKWKSLIKHVLLFLLSAHFVGSCGYLFALQRVSQCLKVTCQATFINGCMNLIDCGRQTSKNVMWQVGTKANNCLLTTSAFDYGIYTNLVKLTTESNWVMKYVFSLFWGFTQISSLAGNETPSYNGLEVIFTMAIRGMGFFLLAFLVGSMQNVLQVPRRRLEMQLRGHEVEQWMFYRHLPTDLRRRIIMAEHYNWAATQGLNEKMLMENMPDDLQRDLRRHFFYFIKNVRLFAMMDEPILDAIRMRLKQKIYIKGSTVMCMGDLVESMVFVVRGELESIGKDEIRVHLSEGDACGEELLIWCLEKFSVNTDGGKIWLPEQSLLSSRTVICLTNVEAFSLHATDLEEVIILFARFLQSPRFQRAIRYELPYWRSFAARRIQFAWRHKKNPLISVASQ
ncbi:hypothetical protein PIB30_029922 [Stylosanthes scabra]|uniref:Cyclic nucleotide-binding domain-containing protein n=1 Tax=Stylosanthes scabra TaxID=79078 RepID=A0ABU6TB69_9FABA|nr:hypothetical protein [Stylosanthes scabra]